MNPWRGKIVEIRFNLFTVLSLISFWSFSWIASMPSLYVPFKGLGVQVVIALLHTLIFSYLWFKKDDEVYNRAMRFSSGSFIVFTGAAVGLAVLCIKSLMESITVDQLYHATVAVDHSLFAAKLMAKKVAAFQNIPIKYLMQSMALLTVAGFVVLFKYAFKLPIKWSLPLMALLFFGLRMVLVIASDGNPDPHPPLRLFPLWLSSAFLGMNDFAFRLPQLLVLSLLVAYVFNQIRIFYPPLLAAVIALAAASPCIVLHTAITAEQPVYTAVLFTAFLIRLCLKKEPLDFPLWFTAAAIAVLFRQSSFTIIVFIGLLWLYQKAKENKLFNFETLIIPASLLLVMLPYLLQSIFFGTASNTADTGGEYAHLTTGLQRIEYSITSGKAVAIIAKNLRLPYLLWLPFGLVIFNRRYWWLPLPFFVIEYSIFYSIYPPFWGAGKYQCEYLFPWFALGFIQSCVWLKLPKRRLSYRAALLASFLVLYNGVDFINRHQYNEPADEMYHLGFAGNVMHTEIVYNYNKALKTVKEQGLAGKSLIIGVTYGMMPQIINGYTAKEYLQEATYHKKLNPFGLKENQHLKIDSCADVETVLIADINAVPSPSYGENRENKNIISAFAGLGWQIKGVYFNSGYRSTITQMVRKPKEKK